MFKWIVGWRWQHLETVRLQVAAVVSAMMFGDTIFGYQYELTRNTICVC
jgi:hypothetical protein